MRRAVTNRHFPMLEQMLRQHFGIELDHDPSLDALAGQRIRSPFPCIKKDPKGRVRILFVDGTEDLSRGWSRDRDIIGQNFGHLNLILVAVPDEFDFTLDGCLFVPKTLNGYLLAVTLHELYEIITGDLSHCKNPGKCINSKCLVSKKGHCCLCMGGLIEEKWPDITLEDLYCEEDLAQLRQVLGR
jgi:hypothetical protein